MDVTFSLKTAVSLSNKNGITQEKTLSRVDFCMRRKDLMLMKENDGLRAPGEWRGRRHGFSRIFPFAFQAVHPTSICLEHTVGQLRFCDLKGTHMDHHFFLSFCF